ncbi:hypothetical protein PR048_010578 [Dryococelus australis]|uniref:Uncharacterized protein n=1 Tax=Dryococelus australis TaxID=614101 RepID=A0ABQ9I498_9NEOP|nr:hypothetical protein PR048_010578 [Dryococelus australis]
MARVDWSGGLQGHEGRCFQRALGAGKPLRWRLLTQSCLVPDEVPRRKTGDVGGGEGWPLCRRRTPGVTPPTFNTPSPPSCCHPFPHLLLLLFNTLLLLRAPSLSSPRTPFTQCFTTAFLPSCVSNARSRLQNRSPTSISIQSAHIFTKESQESTGSTSSCTAAFPSGVLQLKVSFAPRRLRCEEQEAACRRISPLKGISRKFPLARLLLVRAVVHRWRWRSLSDNKRKMGCRRERRRRDSLSVLLSSPAEKLITEQLYKGNPIKEKQRKKKRGPGGKKSAQTFIEAPVMVWYHFVRTNRQEPMSGWVDHESNPGTLEREFAALPLRHREYLKQCVNVSGGSGRVTFGRDRSENRGEQRKKKGGGGGEAQKYRKRHSIKLLVITSAGEPACISRNCPPCVSRLMTAAESELGVGEGHGHIMKKSCRVAMATGILRASPLPPTITPAHQAVIYHFCEYMYAHSGALTQRPQLVTIDADRWHSPTSALAHVTLAEMRTTYFQELKDFKIYLRVHVFNTHICVQEQKGRTTLVTNFSINYHNTFKKFASLTKNSLKTAERIFVIESAFYTVDEYLNYKN